MTTFWNEIHFCNVQQLPKQTINDHRTRMDRNTLYPFSNINGCLDLVQFMVGRLVGWFKFSWKTAQHEFAPWKIKKAFLFHFKSDSLFTLYRNLLSLFFTKAFPGSSLHKHTKQTERRMNTDVRYRIKKILSLRNCYRC